MAVADQASDADAPSASPVASVDKALRVIARLAVAGLEGVPLRELAADLSVNRATLHHTLSALRFRDWIEQTESGAYRLGPGSEPVARWWISGDRLTSLMHPVLQRISSDTNELVHLGRLSEHSVLYLDKVEPSLALRVWSRIGFRAPAVRTALGRALLGARGVDRKDLDLWMQEVPEATREFFERTMAQLELARVRGFAYESEENEAGIACVAVPVLVAGSPQLSVSVSAPAERMNSERVEDLAIRIARGVTEAGIPGVEVLRPIVGTDFGAWRDDPLAPYIPPAGAPDSMSEVTQ